MSIPVLTAGSGSADRVADLARQEGLVTVVRHCEELSELIAACQAGVARAAVITDEAGDLTAALAERVASAGVGLVVLTDSPAAQRRLEALGVRHLPAGVDVSALAAALQEAAVLAGAARGSALADPAAAFDGPSAMAPAAVDTGAEEEQAQARLTVVWGPAGAPGRTTLAVNLAAELAAAGRRVLLVDADTYGGAVAVHLGLLDEAAGAAAACRLADQGLLDAPALLRTSAEVILNRTGRLLALTGIPRPDRWTELRPAALAALLSRARTLVDEIVVDAGFSLETDEEASYDMMAPRRNGATLRALELADRIYAVGAADSVGIPRLVRGLEDLTAAVPTAAPAVVLNKVRAAAVGRSPEAQLRRTWERFGPGSIEAFLPWDPASADAALLAGAALLEAAPNSALRAAVAALAGTPAGLRRRSGRRRPGTK